MTESQEFTLDQLTGRVRTHLRELKEPPCALHLDVMQPFLAMRAAAAADGIDLVAFSSFRDFDRQLGIWNGKFRGERPMQDRSGNALNALELPPAERVEAILWWSALPGASRTVCSPASLRTATASTSPSRAERSTWFARAAAGKPMAASASAHRSWAPKRHPDEVAS